jgi:hypothetical protein
MDHSSWYNPRGPMKLLEWQLQINDPCAITLQQNRHLVRKDSWFTPAIDYKPCNTGGRAPHDPQKSLSMNPPIQLSCPSLVGPPAKTQMEGGNHHCLIHQYNSCPKTKPYEMTKPGRTNSAIGDWCEVICPTNLDDNHETSASSQKITTSATGTQIFFKSNPGRKLELRFQWSLSGAWLQSHKCDAKIHLSRTREGQQLCTCLQQKDIHPSKRDQIEKPKLDTLTFFFMIFTISCSTSRSWMCWWTLSPQSLINVSRSCTESSDSYLTQKDFQIQESYANKLQPETQT